MFYLWTFITLQPFLSRFDGWFENKSPSTPARPWPLTLDHTPVFYLRFQSHHGPRTNSICIFTLVMTLTSKVKLRKCSCLVGGLIVISIWTPSHTEVLSSYLSPLLIHIFLNIYENLSKHMVLSSKWFSNNPAEEVLYQIKKKFKEFKEHSERDTKIKRKDSAKGAQEIRELEILFMINNLNSNKSYIINLVCFN